MHPQEYCIALWKRNKITQNDSAVMEICLEWGKVRSPRGAAKAGAKLALKRNLLEIGEKWEIDVSEDASFDWFTFTGAAK